MHVVVGDATIGQQATLAVHADYERQTGVAEGNWHVYCHVHKPTENDLTQSYEKYYTLNHKLLRYGRYYCTNNIWA